MTDETTEGGSSWATLVGQAAQVVLWNVTTFRCWWMS